jgi:hypothetical protein
MSEEALPPQGTVALKEKIKECTDILNLIFLLHDYNNL